jgi:hypothetical protein
MSSTIPGRLDENQDPDQSAGVAPSEPGGRATTTSGARRHSASVTDSVTAFTAIGSRTPCLRPPRRYQLRRPRTPLGRR